MYFILPSPTIFWDFRSPVFVEQNIVIYSQVSSPYSWLLLAFTPTPYKSGFFGLFQIERPFWHLRSLTKFLHFQAAPSMQITLSNSSWTLVSLKKISELIQREKKKGSKSAKCQKQH